MKQEITVSVSRNLAGVSRILDPKPQSRVINHPPVRLPQPPPQHQRGKGPDDDAMDLDEVSAAMKDAGFLYADF